MSPGAIAGDECVRPLSTALGNAVLLPGSAAYQGALARLFFADASLKRPPCIVQPRSGAEGTRDVASTLRRVRRSGGQLTVRGGGCSALCAADGAVLLDMAARADTAVCAGDDVRLSGGATMGTMLRALAARSRVVPVGVSLLPGLGLPLRGGVGYLTRSMGLTLDHVREVEIVVPSGDILRLSDASAGAEAELWWGVRGCGPSFGVVTGLTLRTHRLPAVYLRRLVLGLDVLPACFAWAPALPRDVTASLVVGTPGARPRSPALYLCVVYAGADDAGIRRVDQEVDAFLARAPGAPFFETRGACRYVEIPPFDVPALDDGPSTAPAPGGQGAPRSDGRIFTFVKSFFLRSSLDRAAAEAVAAAIRAAPTSLCRFDFQHLGGALGDVERTATAFWNRDAEWNWVVTGAWPGRAGEREAVCRWVRATVPALSAHIAGAYSVELRPGLPETDSEVRSAFGENLTRLRALKRAWDPDNVLGCYFPL